MEQRRCSVQSCKRDAEYTCPCSSQVVYFCKKDALKHLELPNLPHSLQSIFEETYEVTRGEVLKFLTELDSKHKTLKKEVLASFSQHFFDAETDLRELMTEIDAYLDEISNWFKKVSQAKRILKSEQDPILGLLSLQPVEAIEKAKMIISPDLDLNNSTKMLYRLSKKIEKMIDITDLFQVGAKISTDSYGTAFRVIKKSNFYLGNGMEYAMKVVNRTSSSFKGIEIEMQILSLVNQYKVHLDSFFVDGDNYFMILDYCSNGSLLKAIDDKIRNNNYFEEDEIWKYFIQICFGLECLHYNDFAHKGLHAQNILLDDQNNVKIANFGISRYMQSKSIHGVSSYCSPRTCNGMTQSKESDIWAIGCLLYYLCNLEHPFSTNKIKIQNEPHKPINNRYSNELRNFIDWCLKKQREERPTVVDILTHQFIINKTFNLGIIIPQTSTMSAAIYRNLLNQEKEKYEILNRKLIECTRENNTQREIIEELLKTLELKNSSREILPNIYSTNNKGLSRPKQVEEIKHQNAKYSQQNLTDYRTEAGERPNKAELEQESKMARSVINKDPNVQNSSLLTQTYQANPMTHLLYNLKTKGGKTTTLLIYNTENRNKYDNTIQTPETLDANTCITQLPSGALFCYGKDNPSSGITLIIYERREVEVLPSGTSCHGSSAIYFNSSVYCFGGINYDYHPFTLSSRFDLDRNEWNELTPLPQADCYCNSIIFNGNILISGSYNKNLMRYLIGNNSFTTIPYQFKENKRKILINGERLYLIECDDGRSIYESEIESDTIWRRIADSTINFHPFQTYCSYNKGRVYIGCLGWSNSTYNISYFKFNLADKTLKKIS